MDLKNIRRGRISEYAEKFKSATYQAIDPAGDHNPLWNVPADCAFPSATQNEVNAKDAQNMVNNGVKLVSEGANMPSVPEAIDIYLDNGILYGLGKAANAGGVAVSALEMSAELHASGLDPRRGRQQAQEHHAVDPRPVLRGGQDCTATRATTWSAPTRRLPQGRQLHDGPGHRLIQSTTASSSEACDTHNPTPRSRPRRGFLFIPPGSVPRVECAPTPAPGR
jgi:hypothetical protein